MEQQKWKRDMDEAAREKGEGEGEDDQDAGPRKSRRGRKPGAKAKAKAASKAKAKAKAKATAAKSKPKAKAKAKAQESAVDDGQKELITPPPRKPRARATGSKRKAEDGSGEVAASDAPVTFAKRYRPSSITGAALWDALRAAYGTVAVQIRGPSTMQACRLKIVFGNSI